MFTGLVADLGGVSHVERSGDGVRLTIGTGLASEIGLGDSVAVNGVCLTAVSVADDAFTTEVMNETLTRSSLAGARPGLTVNLELALKATDRLGGHIMQGHVDGTGVVSAIVADGFARRVTIDAPEDVLRYVVEKGSIAVDGVSLTIAGLDDRRRHGGGRVGSFTVSLIPETLQRTNLGRAEVGDPVNLEVDVVAKYVERLMAR